MREALKQMVTGGTGAGKTYRTFWYQIVPYWLSNRKCLIFDVNDEMGIMKIDPSDEITRMKYPNIESVKIKAIRASDIPLFSLPSIKPEIVRIRPVYDRTIKDKKKGIILHKEGEYLSHEDLVRLLEISSSTFRGGLLNLEDLNSIYKDYVPDNLVSILTRNRHRALDISISLQSVAAINPRLFQNVMFTRYHKQVDSIDKSIQKLQDWYPIYKLAEILVNTHYNNEDIRFFVWINNLQRKIIGGFSKEEFSEAVNEYLSFNKNEFRELLNKLDNNGKKVFNYENAFSHKKDDLIKLYYGNSK